MREYLPRIVDKKVIRYLNIFGAILVQGPKWCGKSTTCAKHSQSQFYIADPEGNFQNRTLAETNPKIVLEGNTPRLIDEWQDAPMIWDAVKFSVDKLGTNGNYILTGSSTPPKHSTFHSGVGRIGKIQMRPMTLSESCNSTNEVSFAGLFEKEEIHGVNKLGLKEIADLCVRGGWPGNLQTKQDDQIIIPKQYIDSLAGDDMTKYDGITRNSITAKKLLASVARNNQTLVTKRTLMADTGVSEPTFDNYFNVLTNLFVFENIPAWSPNIRSGVRLRSAEKTRFVDPSLAIAALNLTPGSMINDIKTFGFMFENLCSRDILTYAEIMGAQVYHYHEASRENSSQCEIDLIVELADGEWGGFEIKLGANQIDEAEKNLLKISKKLQDNGAKPPKCLAVISGLSHYAYETPNGVKIVPIGCLSA